MTREATLTLVKAIRLRDGVAIVVGGIIGCAPALVNAKCWSQLPGSTQGSKKSGPQSATSCDHGVQ